MVSEIIVGISQKEIEIKFDRSKPEGDVDRKADYSKAKTLLGWEPKVEIDKGLAETYRWIDRQVKKVNHD